MRHDLIIIGGGIVGIASAYQYGLRHPEKSVLVLEKEPELAFHQTGRNSGVIHSGIYYKPGSLKAQNCREGREAMIRFCRDERLQFDLCGKVIVATCEQELPRLKMLLDRGLKNGVRCREINRDQLQEIEPHCRGISALLVEDAGIVNYSKVTNTLAARVRSKNGAIRTGTRALRIVQRSSLVEVHTNSGVFSAPHVVNCGGLQSDLIARMSGSRPTAQIIPFRGEYYHVRPEKTHLCRNLIYPVPDPAFPFLGVHFTRTIDGGLECGPNAVLAFGRESYRFFQISPREVVQIFAFRGFQKMAARHWRMGLHEIRRSLLKSEFVRALQRLVPEIHAEYLHPAPAGIRAQAVHSDGSLVDDFLFASEGRVVNVINAPSPAATASLAIGSRIVEKLETLGA